MASSEARPDTQTPGGVAASRRSGSLSHAWHTLARSPRVAILCVGIITLTVSISLAFVQWPRPSVHDEFSYLLASDTFAHGRMSNPTHPMWRYFESFHIIHQPSYASKYPPGQGLMLAVGQILSGTPLVGVWISLAMASMALVWMLAGWMPWRWAILGGLMFALHANIQLAWGHSYWGGAVSFLGGALLFGAYARLRREVSIGNALLLASGAILLAISRPYEGAIACVGVGCALVWQQARSGSAGWIPFCTKLVLPAAMLLALGGCAMGIYNCAVTGCAFRLPYAVHEATYGSSPLFVWQNAKAVPRYEHESLKAFHEGWGLDAWRSHQTLLGFLQAKLDGTVQLWAFFFGALLTVPLIAAPIVFRDRRLRFAWIMLGGLYLASLLVFWMLPHYFAPAAPLLFLVLIDAIRHVRISARRGWPLARSAPAFLVAAQLALLLTATFSLATAPADSWTDDRAAIVDELAAQPGQHLVLVSYDPGHNVHQDWVYNGADLDSEKILWARSLGPAGDEPLLNYFPQRTIWRLNADRLPRVVEPVLPDRDPFADESE